MNLIPTEKTAKWIWNNLVSKNGQCETVQGEILRAIEKLRWEAQNNGNINWDDGFVKLIYFLRNTFISTVEISDEIKESINKDLDRLEHFVTPDKLQGKQNCHLLPCADDQLYDRLVSHLNEYCKIHPNTIKLDLAKYKNYR